MEESALLICENTRGSRSMNSNKVAKQQQAHASDKRECMQQDSPAYPSISSSLSSSINSPLQSQLSARATATGSLHT
eukprot:746852-Hanusia_phi.AAC.2